MGKIYSKNKITVSLLKLFKENKKLKKMSKIRISN